MTGRHKFSELVAKMAPDRQMRIEQISTKLHEEMDLAQLRTARQLSQAALGEILRVEQPAVAKLEKRTDMYVSTLRRFIEAMGGELEIVARFPSHAVRIRNFGDLGEREAGPVVLDAPTEAGRFDQVLLVGGKIEELAKLVGVTPARLRAHARYRASHTKRVGWTLTERDDGYIRLTR
jgi:predicted XRE-type DNA-binding protein